jgi:two-component system response regulator YesN
MKILIVDDEPLILTGIENIIINEFNGCTEIIKGFDGIDALDKLKNFKPDLIITDICMPEMSGLELIEKVSKSGICSRFIILSGYADFEYARQAMRYQALDYILKPIDKVELIDLLNNISKNIDQEHGIKEAFSTIDYQEIAETNNLVKKDLENRYSESVSKMLDYINKNYRQDISLDDVAETVNLHPNYACSLFKRQIGTSFIHYLNSYRITKAKSFIESNTELSLEKIAEMVVYENSCRFIKVFKKYCSITPGEYRSKLTLNKNS